MDMVNMPFRDLEITIDVDVIEYDISPLLSMRDMATNGLDIPIQKSRIRFTDRVQKLDMSHFFLIHRWWPADLPFVI